MKQIHFSHDETPFREHCDYFAWNNGMLPLTADWLQLIGIMVANWTSLRKPPIFKGTLQSKHHFFSNQILYYSHRPA